MTPAAESAAAPSAPTVPATASSAPSTPSAPIPDYPFARATGCPFDPPPELSALQREAPASRVRLWDGSTPWLITRHADQRALLGDPRVSADNTHPHYPHSSPGTKQSRGQGRTFISMDDPEHARQRRMVTAPFAIKRVEALRPTVQGIVDDLIDRMLAGPRPADLVEAFALPVPSLVICALLGVPYADHDFFQSRSRALINRGTSAEDASTAIKELLDYLDDLVGRKLAEPGEDVMTELAQRTRTGELNRAEAARIGRLLLIAGHETTANMIALGTLALLQHPDQLAELREAEDPRTVAAAVEELLRYLNIVHTGRSRVALEDIRLGDVLIKAGDPLVFANDIGNRDAEAFTGDPDRLDIHRDARRHVAFGFGVHQCLGQPLARMELQVVYGTLYRRIPTLRLAAGLDEIPFKHDALIYGVYRLPVTW
ncbi:cytochrome P450 [Phaeacidiphilus oryzae]|uniref:cytochrome P450 n=1 Tax=Phaeacidiphilus oryzae TaxID=348818 RepID=UPI00068B6680|nr:cytochrome P450 [Phaeacidiphilus oryzae]